MNKSEILEDIRNQIGEENLFEENLFEEEGCSTNLTGVSEDNRIVVDLDKKFPSGRWGQKQCECVLFYFDAVSSFVVILIELKGGRNTRVTKAVQQLQSSAEFSDDYVPCGFKNICHPILFHKRPLSKIQLRELRKPESRVPFGGRSFEIKTARCGDKLADVLSQTDNL